MFKYLLVLRTGRPHDPALFVTATPKWQVGDCVTVNTGEQFRIVGISHDLDELDELYKRGINGMWRVEPV